MLSLPIGEGWGKEVIKEEACGYFPCSCVGIEWHVDEKESGRERRKEYEIEYIYIYIYINLAMIKAHYM